MRWRWVVLSAWVLWGGLVSPLQAVPKTHTSTRTPSPSDTPTLTHSPTITITFTASPSFTVTATVTPLPFLWYPNPFAAGSESLVLDFTLGQTSEVSFKVFEPSGVLVKVVADHLTMPGGRQLLTWDG